MSGAFALGGRAAAAAPAARPAERRAATHTLTLLFTLLALAGLLLTALGMYGAMVLAQACDIGAVASRELPPSMFNHLIHGGLALVAVGVIGVVRPHPV